MLCRMEHIEVVLTSVGGRSAELASGALSQIDDDE